MTSVELRNKVSKESVDYSRGMKARHCGICVHFEPPHSCERVQGEIDPDYWCKLFEKRVAKEQPGVAGVHFGTALGNAADERERRRRNSRVRGGRGLFRPHKARVISDTEIGNDQGSNKGPAKPDTSIGTEKADWSVPFKVAKADEDQRLIFGWASIVEVGGEPVVDRQEDVIPVEELERAAYEFVLNSRTHGHMHEKKGTGRLVESAVLTVEKQAALGINLGMVGWWTGWFIEDNEVWQAIKGGELPEFSIGGKAVPEEIE